MKKQDERQAVHKCLSNPPRESNKIGQDSGGYSRFCDVVPFAGLENAPCGYMRGDIMYMVGGNPKYICTRRDDKPQEMLVAADYTNHFGSGPVDMATELDKW